MRKTSRIACWAAISVLGSSLRLIGPVAAQENQPQTASRANLPPSPLEAFAARSTAKVVWSKSVGRLESKGARATITALVVEDVTSSPSLMRGLRIDLAHGEATPGCDWKNWAWRIMCERPNAAVYVEEAQLQEVRKGQELGAAELRPMEFISWYEKSVNSGAGMILLEKGLIVCGYQFSDREPKDLAALLTQGID